MLKNGVKLVVSSIAIKPTAPWLRLGVNSFSKKSNKFLSYLSDQLYYNSGF